MKLFLFLLAIVCGQSELSRRNRAWEREWQRLQAEMSKRRWAQWRYWHLDPLHSTRN